jgi:two-component system sensor histidine kinase BaeS
LANLIDNSLKYATGLTQITVSCSKRSDRIRLTVEDDCEGVPETELVAIFEKFHRVDPSRSRNTGGSGLGLAICRNIIERHGGSIGAYTVKGGGLGIEITLPFLDQPYRQAEVHGNTIQS